MITRKVDSILEAREKERKKQEVENVVETLLQKEQQAQEERQLIAQQISDLELAVLEEGDTRV